MTLLFPDKEDLDVGEESPIHQLSPRLRVAAEKGDPRKIRKVALTALQLPRLRFWSVKRPERKFKLNQVVDRQGRMKYGKFDRVGMINKAGDAFSAMEQADLGLSFWRFYQIMARKPDARAFQEVSFGALNVMLDTVQNGGLRLGDWPIGQTTYKDDDYGLTLNKGICGLRTLWAVGLEAGIPQYRAQAIRSLNYMARSGTWSKAAGPTLMDYAPPSRGWIYYGMSGDTGEPYYLKKDPSKNGLYHIYIMEMLAWMRTSMGAAFPYGALKPFMDVLKDAYVAKGNLYVASNAAAGVQYGAVPTKREPLRAGQLAQF